MGNKRLDINVREERERDPQSSVSLQNGDTMPNGVLKDTRNEIKL